LPTVTLCVSLADSCPPCGEGEWQPVPVTVPGLDGEALLYGEPDILEQWEEIRWSLDAGPAQAGW
jgi:hypothetical protein